MRAAWLLLLAACTGYRSPADSEEMRRRIDELLRAHDAAGGFLETPASATRGASGGAPAGGPGPRR